MALNSFRKHCSNVLSAALRFFENLAQNHTFLLPTKCKVADKILELSLAPPPIILNINMVFLQVYYPECVKDKS